MDVDGGGHLLNVHLTSCLLLLVWLYHAYCYYSCPWIYDRFFFLFICIVRELFRKFCNYMQNNIPMMIAIDSHKKLLWIKTINIQTHTHIYTTTTVWINYLNWMIFTHHFFFCDAKIYDLVILIVLLLRPMIYSFKDGLVIKPWLLFFKIKKYISHIQIMSTEFGGCGGGGQPLSIWLYVIDADHTHNSVWLIICEQQKKKLLFDQYSPKYNSVASFG